jgi:chitodextrinase
VGTTNWRFGDGGKANGAKASHVYRRPGRFTVTVTSEDGLGHTTTVTRVVRVRG